ncbi:F-box and WD-40 domain protein 1/11 [Geosmithia morbida]|uniref:F-box and WD-40 domain protein 1/11 n=1 Tax=Geosmithia morbida TaxID=1094350 RepID=A0A9P4YUG1_9HYPO|nr:F-box and WD-40 domain protein 1/11 [Geosmithia morbida]KAF4122032.1 F-box and WD-40 domain protein 1/11 [Geosmithia morbida]
MAKRDRLTMNSTHQPDEGYSEDPLNSGRSYDLPAVLSTLKLPADLPAWVSENASSIPISLKKELAMALLHQLPTSAISEIVQQLHPRLYINFVHHLPAEICLKILSYLDPNSLVCVIQTCRDWCDLAVDPKLWERLYRLEGWKAIQSEIESCETSVNIGLNDSISHLHRIQNAEGHTSKIRALQSDDTNMDVPMSDGDRAVSPLDNPTGRSIFGSGSTSSRPHAAPAPLVGGPDSDRATTAHRRFGSSDLRHKRRAVRAPSEASLPPILPPKDPRALRRSTLWMWDGNNSRYRLNWKYLYNMRRRLESNWELGKAVPFQFPHPNHPEEGHSECIYTLQFDANYLVSGSRDKTMRVWNVHTRRLMRPPLVGHDKSVLCLQFDSDPDEDLLVSGSSDSNIIIWKFSTGEILQKIQDAHYESVLNVRFDKRVLVTSSKDKSIKIFNRRPLKYGDLGYNQEVVQPTAIRLRNYGYEPELSQQLPIQPAFTMIGKLDGHGAAVNAIQIRGNSVVSVSGDRHIKIWDWPRQVCTKTIPAHDKGIACVEFDGRRIVSGSSDYEVSIFDAPTGLRVAELKGHAHLVRTVQAGFGDLPYSEVEDRLEAKRVDARYFKAVETGMVGSHSERTSRGERRVNAGSSHPADVQAYGAHLPPGGGGGRKYSRIVSGSYDQSIIIWRRDKEGVWKPAHHLRQEEAAEAAQRREAIRSNSDPIASLMHMATQPAAMPLVPSATPRIDPGMPLPTLNQTACLPLPNVHDAQPHLSGGVYTALIDQVVPAGAHSLQQALANYPGMLSYRSYLHMSIDREPSTYVRAQLRQVVTDALVTMHNAQRAFQQATAPIAGQETNSSAGGTAGSTASGSGAPESARARVAPSDTEATAGLSATPVAAAAATQGPPAQRSHQAQQAPPVPANAVPMPDNAPARVFKLQFDARKIICCSQAPIIVGWDFCNDDPELEGASRFFATVD